MKSKVSDKSGHKIGVVRGEGFIPGLHGNCRNKVLDKVVLQERWFLERGSFQASMETAEIRYHIKWSYKRGGSWKGVHSRPPWNCKSKVSDKVVLNEGWSVQRGSFRPP